MDAVPNHVYIAFSVCNAGCECICPEKTEADQRLSAVAGERRRPRPLCRVLGAADDICSAVLHAPYDKLQRLICRGDLSAADSLPDYAVVAAAYYAMFRRRDLNLAEDLLEVLKSRNLHYSEEYAVGVLKAAYKAVKTCSIRPLCGTAAVGWSALLKELIALHFAYDAEAAKRLKCRAAKMFKQYEVYSSGAGRRAVYLPDPLLYFIFHAADRVEPLPTCRQTK